MTHDNLIEIITGYILVNALHSDKILHKKKMIVLFFIHAFKYYCNATLSSAKILPKSDFKNYF